MKKRGAPAPTSAPQGPTKLITVSLPHRGTWSKEPPWKPPPSSTPFAAGPYSLCTASKRAAALAEGGTASGLYVLDVDGIEGAATLRDLGHTTPPTVIAKTGGGGWHYLFKHPGGTCRNTTGKIGPKVDTRGDGGYIVAPPSSHQSGGSYEWIMSPEAADPAPPPAWLTSISEGDNGKGPAPEVVGPIPVGEQHNTLLSLAGTMRRRGLTGEEILAAFKVMNQTRMASAWTDKQLADLAFDLESRYQPAEPLPTAAELPLPIAEQVSPFVDWSTFWDREHAGEDWVYPDVLARGRGHALYAGHKCGKSLLMLFIAAQMATGAEPVVVLYLDFEMTTADVLERLEDMGYGPESDLSRLRYALLPTIPPLDTAPGATALAEMVDGIQADYPDHHLVVIVDTIGRVITGGENDSDTWRSFYAHSGIEMKRRGATWVRLDHGGKDLSKGQRGSSGKGDDVDVVWKLAKTDDGLSLTRDVARMNWVREKVLFSLSEDPLAFTPAATSWPMGTGETADRLDTLGVPLDASTRKAQTALKEAGEGRRREVIVGALRWRRERAEMALRMSGTTPGTTPR